MTSFECGQPYMHAAQAPETNLHRRDRTLKIIDTKEKQFKGKKKRKK
jgi:hypothetical protein